MQQARNVAPRQAIFGIAMLGAAMLLCPSAAEAQPRRFLGKIFFSNTPIKDRSAAALTRKFSGAKARMAIKRNKEKAWAVEVVAFFRKESFGGPVTFWIYDLKDKASIRAREPVTAKSIDATPTKIFVHKLFIDPNLGFNKNRSYLIRVGQIIKGRHKIYASGQVDLKP